LQSIDTAKAGLAAVKQKLADLQAGPSASDITAAQNSLASAQASLTSANAKYTALLNPSPDQTLPMLANVESARANLASAQRDLSSATIVAPFDGQISQLNGAVGTQVNSNTVVFILLNPKLIRIDANVDQADINSLKVGQASNITFDAIPSRSYAGT